MKLNVSKACNVGPFGHLRRLGYSYNQDKLIQVLHSEILTKVKLARDVTQAQNNIVCRASQMITPPNIYEYKTFYLTYGTIKKLHHNINKKFI